MPGIPFDPPRAGISARIRLWSAVAMSVGLLAKRKGGRFIEENERADAISFAEPRTWGSYLTPGYLMAPSGLRSPEGGMSSFDSNMGLGHPSLMTIPRRPSVAVVVPIYRRDLLPDEQQSLRHLDAYLESYDRFFVAPESLDPRRRRFEVMPFPDHYFESIASYSRLLLSTSFYQRFESYRFILIYQLDSLVFSDSLAEWCEVGWDYIGAPWLADPADPKRGLSRVGNGGFSLRRVGACLKVLESEGTRGKRSSFFRDLLRAPLPDLAPYRLLKRIRVLSEARRGVEWYTARYSLNEDHFWSDRARLFSPDFRIAPVAAALAFAFEQAPRYCFARGDGRLPFGCHAWSRWDRTFWEPYLATGEQG